VSLVDLLSMVRAALANRGRAALTLLGIMIGAATIVLLASLMRGGEEALIAKNQQAVDADLITVSRAAAPVSDRDRTRRELSRTDARLLEGSEALGGAAVGGESTRPARAELEGRKKKVSLISSNPGALALYRLEVAKGRFLADDDLAERRRVCVVGAEVWTELLQGRADLGATHLTVDGRLWSVVGVLARKPILGSTDSTDLWDRRVLIPETTYDTVLSPGHEVDRLYVRRKKGPVISTPMDALRRVVAATLTRRHLGVGNFKLEDAQGRGQEELIFLVIKVLLLSTGLIALFVGGINIMNVMLVTVTERTREIGVRRAVGASPRAILLQFLIEASFLAFVGGLLGVALGAGLAWLAAQVLNNVLGTWAFHLELWSVALGLGLSALTGVVFGIYPAWRAAKLDPIEALRAE
jgi:putative ABC transport system permease protein